jgi:hypothetical protein
MKFKFTITIQKPIKEVTHLFANRAMLSQWQPDLLNSQQIENYPFPKYTHQLALGRRKILLTESILRNELPAHFDTNFKLKGMSNKVCNSFKAIGTDTTQWDCTSEYTFRGIMKLISFFMKENLKKQSELLMSNFKRFAESRGQ